MSNIWNQCINANNVHQKQYRYFDIILNFNH